MSKISPILTNFLRLQFKKLWVKIAFLLSIFCVVVAISAFVAYKNVKQSLPNLQTLHDYEPLLVSQVYDRKGKKIGEFFRQRRILVPYEKMPKNLVNAFLAAEDDQFFHHGGINYQSILRATIANIKAGKSVQGGSTITQQVAKTLLLSPEKTLLRKLREALLALQIEEKLSKEEILYLYLNQIYFGQGAYGVEAAAQTYFRKSIADLKLSEMAILAGLPQAPTKYSPVHNSIRAKERQVYVLKRMAEVDFIKKDESDKAIIEPVVVYVRENYEEFAPYYLETVRQLLIAKLGEDQVLDKGLKINTSLDLDKQLAAQESLVDGLKSLDKRQGFRGPIKNMTEPKDLQKFLEDERKKLVGDSTPERTILPDGKFAEIVPARKVNTSNLPSYLKRNQSLEGIVMAVDDKSGLVEVHLPDSKGLIAMETMTWARKPDNQKRFDLDTIKKPSQALKLGDVILVKIVDDKFEVANKNTKNEKTPNSKTAPGVGLNGITAAGIVPVADPYASYLRLELDQEPLVEGALISFDQETQDVLALVGGYSFARNEYNRALQAARQTGSVFKAIVYASALDKNYNPSTSIMDVPIVYEEKTKTEDEEGQEQETTKVWKPANHSKSFNGDIIFRNALVKSLNSPTVKIIEDIGVTWVADYSKRLGIFSPLNMDFTLALGSSSVTLYEMTKVFSQFGNLGKRMRPKIIHSVTNQNGTEILGALTLDEKYAKEIGALEKEFSDREKEFKAIKEPEKLAAYKKADINFFLQDPEQVIKPTTAYLMTSLLKGVIEDPNGTGARARSIGREAAAKTGTTNGYYDGWFVGYTPQISTGVWVGFDKEQSIGVGEVGGRAALPIWVEYMKQAHRNIPETSFPTPEGILFANIDADSGKLASAHSKHVIRQAFVSGTEPTSSVSEGSEDSANFYKQDLNE